jgi:hypothetical protein
LTKIKKQDSHIVSPIFYQKIGKFSLQFNYHSLTLPVMSKDELLQERQPNKKVGAPQKNKFDFDDGIIPGFPLSAEMKNVDSADLAIIRKRVAAWHEKYPYGEPQAKKLEPYRVFIDVKDIMLLFKKSLRASQRLLKNTRDELKKKKGTHLTINEFCAVNDYNAEEIREFLMAVDAADEELAYGSR